MSINALLRFNRSTLNSKSIRLKLERSFQMVKLGLTAIHNYTNYIKTNFLKGIWICLQINEGHLMNMLLLGFGNGFLRRTKAGVGAGLYLHKDDTLFPPANDVYFSIAAAEISMQDLVPLLLKIFRGNILTQAAKHFSGIRHLILSP